MSVSDWVAALPDWLFWLLVIDGLIFVSWVATGCERGE